MTRPDDAVAAVRADVALGCRVLEEIGLDDLVWGHVGARDPTGRGVWVKSSGMGFEEVRPEDVIPVAWDGSVVEGDGRPPIEYPIHTEIMAARSDVGVSVHAHPAHSIAFMATGEPLRPISHDGAWPGDDATVGLTGRERDVLQLLVTGASNQEIGQALYVSARTVKAHVASIFEKLDVRDRTAAAMVALRRGTR